MRIITLIENLVYSKNLLAEHGLSLYIETGNRKVLFDTGQTSHFIHNASVLGIDLTAIDAVVISHGHYDHTGGLYPFLKINNRAQVHIKKEAFYPKYHGADKFIGINYDAVLDKRVIYVNHPIQLDDDLYIMPDIPVLNMADTNFDQLKIKTSDGLIDDMFDDELYLAITANKKLSVISSCSHRGIINIMLAAKARFSLPVNTILGGFHIRNNSDAQMDSLIRYLKELSPKAIGICHCTGVEKYAELACHFKDKVFYNYTGNVVLVSD